MLYMFQTPPPWVTLSQRKLEPGREVISTVIYDIAEEQTLLLLLQALVLGEFTDEDTALDPYDTLLLYTSCQLLSDVIPVLSEA